MPGPLPKYPIQLTREQEGHLQHLSPCYTAPFAAVQRARILLLAHQQPLWRNAEIARQVGGCVNTVRHWRQRWPPTDSVRDAPRAGTRRTFTPLQRAQIIALACSAPRTHGKPWPRWSGGDTRPGRRRTAERGAHLAGDDPALAARGQEQPLALSLVAALDCSTLCGQGRAGARALRTRPGVGRTGGSGGVQ